MSAVTRDVTPLLTELGLSDEGGLQPTAAVSAGALLDTARALLPQVLPDTRGVRLLGVTLSGFPEPEAPRPAPAPAAQLSLFAP